MNVLKVERTDWEPSHKNQRIEEDLPADVPVIHNPTKLVDKDNRVIAIMTRAPDKHRQELSWLGRAINEQVDFTDIGSVNGGARMSGIKYPNRTFGTTAPSPMRRRLACCYAQLHLWIVTGKHPKSYTG